MVTWTREPALSETGKGKKKKKRGAHELGRMLRFRAAAALAACALGLTGAGVHCASTVQSRKHLLYNHLPKCGGTFTRALLPDLVPNVSLVEEFRRSTWEDQRTHFVIASVRDPCSYYVSLFAFASRGFGAVAAMVRNRDARAAREIFNNTRGPRAGFGKFLEVAAGCFTLRVFRSLPGLHVDCWMRTKELVDDLRVCLTRFEAQGGVLNKHWRKTLDEKGRESGRNPSSHGECTSYYPPSYRALVEMADQSMCELLGGCHCCTSLPPGAVDPSSRLARRAAVPLIPTHLLESVCWRHQSPPWRLFRVARGDLEPRAPSGTMA